MEFEEIRKGRLNPKQSLWRYLDIHKFYDLIVNMKLHFSRCDQINDPLEALTKRIIVEKYECELKLSSDIELPPDVIAACKKRLEQLEIQSTLRRQTQFINCWLKSDRESVAMWNLYSSSSGVAIKINGRKLVSYFKKEIFNQNHLDNRLKFIIGSVSYHKLSPYSPYDETSLPDYGAFKKEKAYEFEKEFRMLIVTPNSMLKTNPTFFKVNLTNDFFSMVDVLCHPKMPNWQFQNISNICKTHGLKLPLKSAIKLL